MANVSIANVKHSGRSQDALNHLIDHEIDLRAMDFRFCNDETDARSYLLVLLLKVILFAYSSGSVSSRDIEAACSDRVHDCVYAGSGLLGLCKVKD
jgi:hypothetical protein